MTEIEETIKSLEEMFPNGLCEVDEYKMAQVAINALEKQIPKKRDSYNCPVCFHYFEDGECFTYCPECGQRLE